MRITIAGLVAFSAILCSSPSASVAQAAEEYERSGRGTRVLAGQNGFAIEMLVEASNLGSSEVEVGRVTFPAGSRGGAHLHGSIEIFYVLSGVMEHVVNGEAHRIEPGDVAIVKPGDRVEHRVLSDEPVEALVIWAPGGEAERIAPFFTEVPVQDD